MRLLDLRHSNIARLTVAYAALIVLSLGILLSVILIFIAHDIREQLREVIEQDARTLSEIYHRQGLDALKSQIQILANSVEARRSFYLLTDNAARPLAGDAMPMEAFDGWREIAMAREDKTRSDRFLIYSTMLGNTRLFVGRRLNGFAEIEKATLHSFAWAFVILIPIALLGGIFLSRRAFHRIGDIEGAMQAFARGDLSARAALTGSHDEMDRLAGNINGSLDRIERLMADVKQVTNDIAHDLRTPVGRLRLRLERALAKSDTEAKAEIRESICDIGGILSTFDALLQIAEIDVGHARTRFGSIDLTELMQEVYETYGSVAEDSGHRLQLAPMPDLTVHGDRQLLAQLVVNLIENALRHTPAGSRIMLSASKRDHRIVACVADDGPGIPAAERTHVFRRFYRLDASRNMAGNGLGLPIVKAIADLHGADVTLTDNHPGLIVCISFPDEGSSRRKA